MCSADIKQTTTLTKNRIMSKEQNNQAENKVLHIGVASKSFYCENKKFMIMEKQCSEQCMACAIEDIRKITQ